MDSYLDDRKAKVETFKKNIRKKAITNTKFGIPEGLFLKCEECNEHIFYEDLIANNYVCPKCDNHFRLSARKRINTICDENTFIEMFCNLQSANPLCFPKYEEKLTKYQGETCELDAFVCGTGEIGSQKVSIGVLDSYFMMGSMGSAVGEKVTRLIEYATLNKLPLVIFSASGGARMHEGIISLMQMAKTSAAIKKHNEEKLLYISVLTNPTTGGVAASFAFLGDIIIAEKNALIGFAGQRVIKQTINQDLPDGFQTADFQLEKGAVDMVVNRKQLKETIAKILMLHKKVN